MLHALAVVTTLAVACLVAGCGLTSHEKPAMRAEDLRTGIVLMLPADWRLRDDRPNGSGAMMLSTYPIAHLGDLSETPPNGATWVLLYDYGRSEPRLRGRVPRLPSRLPPEQGYEIFGTARLIDFSSDAHHFTAYVKGSPKPAVMLGILRSIHVRISLGHARSRSTLVRVS